MRTLGVAVVLALAGCAPVAVHMDYDPDVDFSHYATFSWMPEVGAEQGEPHLSRPFLAKRVKKAVLENLTGLRKVTSEPDLLIAHHITFKRKANVQVHGYGYWGHRPVDVQRYREGTLVLDFVDAGTGELVWRGWSVSTLHPASSPQEEQAAIRAAVGEILKQYPPY